jgi:hypothetical protein
MTMKHGSANRNFPQQQQIPATLSRSNRSSPLGLRLRKVCGYFHGIRWEGWYQGNRLPPLRNPLPPPALRSPRCSNREETYT